MPLPFQYSSVKPQGPYTGSACVGVLSSRSLLQEPSLRNQLRVQGMCAIVDLHEFRQHSHGSPSHHHQPPVKCSAIKMLPFSFDLSVAWKRPSPTSVHWWYYRF